MAQQMPNASVQTVERVGHNMKVEIPDLLAGPEFRREDRIRLTGQCRVLSLPGSGEVD